MCVYMHYDIVLHCIVLVLHCIVLVYKARIRQVIIDPK